MTLKNVAETKLNTEDKRAWCERYGVEAELAFSVGRMHNLGLATYPNPAKLGDKYSHDLFTIFPTDLKAVRTPLFKAKDLYGIDPQYAVTFNVKDAIRYKNLYPNIAVLFDVNWSDVCSKEICGTRYEVKPMHHTYVGFLTDIRSAISKSGDHRIEYARRVGDTDGNAKVSFVFDVRHLHKLS